MHLDELFRGVRLRQLDHILDVLLRRAIQREQPHLIAALLKRPCLQVIFDLTVLAVMGPEQLPHLLGEHVLGVRVDLAEGDERDVGVGGRSVGLVERLLVLVLVVAVALLVGE